MRAMSEPPATGSREDRFAGLPQFHRLIAPAGPELTFSINGQRMHASSGDTVLTAILTNTDHVRRFDFSNAGRAGFCLIGACQDCWVTCGDGRRVRACSTLLTDGMEFVI